MGYFIILNTLHGIHSKKTNISIFIALNKTKDLKTCENIIESGWTEILFTLNIRFVTFKRKLKVNCM